MPSQPTDTSIPKLRFPEFTGEWENNPLGKISDVRDGTHDSPKYQKDGYPLITSKNLLQNGELDLENVSFISETDFANINKRSKVDVGDILFGMIGTIGNPVLVKSNNYAIKNVALIKKKSKLSMMYLIHYLSGTSIAKQFFQQNTGGTQKFLSLGIIRSLEIGYPKKEEQQKIASFLGAVDDKIAGLQKKKDLLEAYKKGMMQRLFSQSLRFTDTNGNPFPDWEEKKLGDIASYRKNKNNDLEQTRVLTNSANQGIIDQRDYFDHDIANSENLGGYYIVELGDFVYNPRISSHAPVGPIKRNNLAMGIMSPLYSVFYFNQTQTDFWQHYFSSTNWHRYMKQVANYGARHDRMAISTKDFMLLPVPYLHPDEQKKIADFLSAIDDKIALVVDELSHAKTFKKGLLQQMFV